MPEDSVLTDNSTSISPAGLGFTFVMCCLLLGLPRRWAPVPIILLICFMTLGERLTIAGLDFTMLRILMLVGWVRVICRGEASLGKWCAIDRAMIAFLVSGIITYTILWGTSEAFINRLGQAYNVIGSYFLFRCLIRGFDEVVIVTKVLAVCSIPLAMMMVIEKASGTNPFAIFGGVPLMSAVRNGAVRCQGPFAHPILAGTFGATIYPFFIGLLHQKIGPKWLAITAIISSLVIVAASASSGPMIALIAGSIAVAFWFLRVHMRAIRWGILGMLVALHLVMKAPVWFLIARIDLVSGSTSYYRSLLIDNFIRHFGDWWLVGIKNTGVWADASIGLHDRTNQYIVIAADGGLVTLVCFLLIIAYSFRAVGTAVHKQKGRPPEFLAWVLGSALFAHVVNYVSVSYFDQNGLNWFLLLSMIATISSLGRKRKNKTSSQRNIPWGNQRILPVAWQSRALGIRS